MRQITYWLDYLNSIFSIPPLPSTPGFIPKWNVILVGVRADEQQDFSLTQDPLLTESWKSRFPKLPIVPRVLSVSSLKSSSSVRELIQFVDVECGRILDNHATQIPSSYRIFLSKLHDLSKTNPLIHWNDLHTILEPEMEMGQTAFKTMLRYTESIGRIVWLPTGIVFTDPTIAPKIAAKFISPKDIRLRLLKQETDIVQILDETEIGSLLAINTSHNERCYNKIIIFSNE